MLYSASMAFTDIRNIPWIQKWQPHWEPYASIMRLDRPIGWWLLLLPSWWSLFLAKPADYDSLQFIVLLCLFLVGAVIMRAAGCIINDLWDRDLDKQVERTQARPLASGEMSFKQALALLAVLMSLGFAILLSLTPMAIILGFLAIPLIVIYPLMKRYTFWPQLVLGFTFNFGALMGWASIHDSLSFVPICLYGACIFWTLGYDTIYAHQDKEDDMRVGVKSTALKFGDSSKLIVSFFFLISWILLLLCVYVRAHHSMVISVMALPAAYMAWQLIRWDIHDQDSCLKSFQRSRNYGLLVFGILVLDSMLMDGGDV